MRYLFIISFLFGFNVNGQSINWISFEEAFKLQQTNPKNIIVDVYTSWCGPCKLLDRNTFQNKQVADFINKNFYAVKFNAEGNAVIKFDDKEFTNPNYKPEMANRRNGNHQLTRYLGVSAYPTVVFIDDNSDIIYKLRGIIPLLKLKFGLSYLKIKNTNQLKVKKILIIFKNLL